MSEPAAQEASEKAQAFTVALQSPSGASVGQVGSHHPAVALVSTATTQEEQLGRQVPSPRGSVGFLGHEPGPRPRQTAAELFPHLVGDALPTRVARQLTERPSPREPQGEGGCQSGSLAHQEDAPLPSAFSCVVTAATNHRQLGFLSWKAGTSAS